MIRKSAWLLSAGLVVLSATPASRKLAVHRRTPTRARPADQGATAKPPRSRTRRANGSRSTPATSSSPRLAATRRCPTCRWRSARSRPTRFRIPARATSASFTRLSPSLLVSSTTSEGAAAVARIRGIGTVGDNPGLEGSVAVFIDGVYRSRTGVAPDRARPARPHRSPARPAGHPVRPQHFGRPDFDHHRQAAVSDLSVGRRSSVGNYDMRRARGERQRTARRDHRRAPRRRVDEARRIPQGRHLGAPASTTATAGCCAANCCSSPATTFRFG